MIEGEVQCFRFTRRDSRNIGQGMLIYTIHDHSLCRHWMHNKKIVLMLPTVGHDKAIADASEKGCLLRTNIKIPYDNCDHLRFRRCASRSVCLSIRTSTCHQHKK